MSSILTSWKLLFIWVLQCYRAEGDGIYECGAHGRFEYCIDDIPGCIVGCHCHPGYYFDTETKICEPNSKLTQNYRRHYIPEPTRVQNSLFLSNSAQTESLPVLTTHNVIDEKVNDITKNADDLGDWLYNQFFKTIENQVINKTSKDSQLTRRSGRGPSPKRNKLKRRARRKGNKHKKKKKYLRGKLLRIAEDDSLFESSDSSDSESSSSEFIHSTSSSESDSDEDHGHKKILLINKKPRAPLPSFIFLPNMNTPYYPPIGLPPPPVMPMYPMVPVPPMLPAPPLMPIAGHAPECEENTTTVKTAAVKTTAPSTTVTETIATETTTVASTTSETDELSTIPPSLRNRNKGRKKKRLKSHENIPDDYEELPSDIYDPSRDSRQKLVKLLRQKMNYPRIDGSYFKKPKKPYDKYMDQLIPPDTLIDNDITDYIISKDENSSPTNLESKSELQNVDFKYLSQLIHRVNENQTENVQNSLTPVNSVNNNWLNKKYHDFSSPINSGRRINQKKMTNTKRNHATDDTFYSNLGRQIATLIRTIDSDKQRQFDIEIEKVQQKTNNHPYFNENEPRTFWERSVRSPLTFYHSFKNRFDNVKNSNEILFNIENKVETIASTVPTLSLHELENLINVMQTARTRFQSNTSNNNFNRFNKTLNVNLWPQEVKQSKKASKDPVNSNVFNVKRRQSINYANRNTEPLKTKSDNIRVQHPYPFTSRVALYKSNDDYINRGLQLQPIARNMTKMFIKPISLPKSRKLLHSSEKRWHTMKPTILNYKNIKKYFFDNNNQYSFQNDNLRLHYPPISRASQQLDHLVPSPYFHREINHIDYMS